MSEDIYAKDFNDYHDETVGNFECQECGEPISGSEHQDGAICGTCLQDRDCED